MLGRQRTKEEQQRIDAIHERGCVPCYLEALLSPRRWLPEPCDIHHVYQGNHLKTYGNCPWHHRGVPKHDLRPSEMTLIFGPSMARNPGKYRARYGDELALLAHQDRMLLKSVRELQRETG